MQPKMDTSTIVKLGIVTPDIQETAAAWGRLFDIPPPEVHLPGDAAPQRPEAMRHYRGQAIQNIPLKWALVGLEPIYLELLEPADDTPSPWRTHLQRFGPSVCFLSFYVQGFTHHVDMLQQQGYALDFFEEKGFERYGYFDTLRALGVTLECKERVPLETLPPEDRP